MTTKSPAFQFYPSDWLSSPKVAVMTPAQEGAYIRLLCYCWGSGDCSIPDNDEQLAIISRLGEGWLKGGSTVVRQCFTPHPSKPGYLTNERLLSEAVKQEEWRRKSAEGGRKSRANAERSKGGSRVVQPKANSSSSSSVASTEGKPSSEAALPNVDLPDWVPLDTWKAFVAMRRSLGKEKELTDEAAKRIIAKLGRLRDGGDDPEAVLDESIISKWAGIFPLKGKTGGNHAKPTSRHTGINDRDFSRPPGNHGFATD